MGMVIAAFVLGCAVGMCVYRKSIIVVLGRNPYTKCDYCQFRMMMGKEPSRLFKKSDGGGAPEPKHPIPIPCSPRQNSKTY